MSVRNFCLIAGFTLVASLQLQAADPWLRLRSAHFELITNGGQRFAPGLLFHLEGLRRLLLKQVPLPEESPGAPTRIIAFRSASEYAAYRLNENTDAYYVGATGRDYIVMSLSGPADFKTASHEYVHVMARRQGLHLPAWLSEGLAEVFSTVRFHTGQAILGEANPARLQALLHTTWLPLAQVMALEKPPISLRDESALFYAESWALTHMLLFSPAYNAHFGPLLRQFVDATPTPAVVREVYGTSPPSARELRAWITRRDLPSLAAHIGSGSALAVRPEPIAPSEVQLALAELQWATGRREQSREVYLRLEAEFPDNPEIQSALGHMALEEGRRHEARIRFQRVISGGITNARLCYEYAMLAQDDGVPEAEVVAALERSVTLDPNLDDARFALVLAHMNAGRYAAALDQLQALHQVPERRAFAYYYALANAQFELGLRDDAVRSAAEAHHRARTGEEVAKAANQTWMAQSEIVAQLSRDGPGHLVRVPLDNAGSTAGWNPFIAPGDRIERQEGALREVDCSVQEIRLSVIVNDRRMLLSIPDLGRVQVRKAGSGVFDLTCGPQDDPRVLVEYAVSTDPAITGLLRGIQFLP